MPERFSPGLLRALRNDIPISELIRVRLDLPWKESEGYLRFLCPRCNEFHTATNPQTNLARCFRCRLNFNPIDMVMTVQGCGFVDAVNMLVPLLEARRQSVSAKKTTRVASPRRGPSGGY